MHFCIFAFLHVWNESVHLALKMFNADLFIDQLVVFDFTAKINNGDRKKKENTREKNENYMLSKHTELSFILCYDFKLCFSFTCR